MKLAVLLFVILVVGLQVTKCNGETYNYTDVVKKIKDLVKNDSKFHHSSYETLAYLSDTYGPRLWGSPSLELFLMDLNRLSRKENISSRLEPVTNISRWIRGKEELYMLSPRPFPQKLGLIGLGRTNPCKVTGEAVVVDTFDELSKVNVTGKIVVFNEKWVNYGETVQYRSEGAKEATKKGAIAALVRSVTPFSIYSPHTGIHDNGNGSHVCSAAITVEDAEMMKRMQLRKQKIVLSLTLESEIIEGVNSNNFIAEIKGRNDTLKNKVVLFGGHTDSWDTGSQTGANDDGGGIITCWEALRVLNHLNLIPKRTLRVIGWSGEEQGASNNGAQQYFADHRAEIKDHVLAFESDEGSTKPMGFGFNGNPQAVKIVKDIAEQNFADINCTKIIVGGGGNADVEPLEQVGIPIMNNYIDEDDTHPFYFQYHHSAGDSMTMMNPDDMDDNVIAIAAMMYIIADLDNDLPNDYKDTEIGKI